MTSNTSLVARQCRLQKWAEEVRACQGRPAEMTVSDWCSQNGINPKTYYNHLTEVRKACLEQMPAEAVQNVVSVPASVLPEEPCTGNPHDSGLAISCGRYRIHVTEDTSPQLLRMVLQVTADVE